MTVPVTLVKLGFTYSMHPSRSVIMTVTGICSMARESFCSDSSACFLSVRSRRVSMAAITCASALWMGAASKQRKRSLPFRAGYHPSAYRPPGLSGDRPETR